MAYIIFSSEGGSVEREQLAGQVVLGRLGECGVTLRDSQVSRRHCRLEPTRGGGWVVVDLGSKNGTRVNGHRVARYTLRDGDVLRVGRVTVRFRLGKLPGASAIASTKLAKRRPADPIEALADTVCDFDPVEAARVQREHNWPTPRPVPPEPAAYAREDVYSMLSGIASSSWDSIYASSSLPSVIPAAALPMMTPEADRPRPKRPARPEPIPSVSNATRGGFAAWMANAARAIARQAEALRRRIAPVEAMRML